jgi:tight adherence protein C
MRLSYAGFRGDAAASVFLMLQLFGLRGAGVLAGGAALLFSNVGLMTLLKVIGAAGIGFFFPDILVWFMGRSRKQAIFLGLPDALDLMVVCVEAGLGLDQAMRKVADEMKKSYRVIADEFNLCNMQLQMGRGRTEVLQDLGKRNGVDDLRTLASIIIQADKFGSSIAQALRVQSDAMRTRRRQIAEEKAAKTAVKLIFPLVIFIFPGIFVVLVGPAAITMIREMFPAMQGAK